MMDGWVEVFCVVFDEEGFLDIGIMFYIVKYVSVFYGLFCDVFDSVLVEGEDIFVDKKIY